MTGGESISLMLLAFASSSLSRAAMAQADYAVNDTTTKF